MNERARVCLSELIAVYQSSGKSFLCRVKVKWNSTGHQSSRTLYAGRSAVQPSGLRIRDMPRSFVLSVSVLYPPFWAFSSPLFRNILSQSRDFRHSSFFRSQTRREVEGMPLRGEVPKLKRPHSAAMQTNETDELTQ